MFQSRLDQVDAAGQSRKPVAKTNFAFGSPARGNLDEHAV